MIQFWRLTRELANLNASDEWAFRHLCQDIVYACLSLASVGALEGVVHAAFGGYKQKFSEE